MPLKEFILQTSNIKSAFMQIIFYYICKPLLPSLEESFNLINTLFGILQNKTHHFPLSTGKIRNLGIDIFPQVVRAVSS